MKKYLCIGYPDEENIYHQHHTSREKWTTTAKDLNEAYEKAWKHFYYFHEVMVEEIEDK